MKEQLHQSHLPFSRVRHEFGPGFYVNSRSERLLRSLTAPGTGAHRN